MVSWIRNAALLGGMAITFAGLTGTPTVSAERPITVRGLVERLPDTADSRGEWTIGGRPVMVGPQTRLQERVAGVETAGYWTQAVSGVVVRAPGWSSDAAHAAGFRPALREEVGGFSLGRPVKAKVQAAQGGLWQALEIELQDEPRGARSR